GYGIDNYRYKFGIDYGGYFAYSHNNFIEILVGTGILGIISFYLAKIFIIKDLYSIKENNSKKALNYLFIALVVSYFFLSISSVYYYSKQYSIVIVMASIIRRVYFV